MKAIKNIKNLPGLLKAENPLWQELIFERTGVIVIFRNHYVVLLSACGYIDLDIDSEYRYFNGDDLTKYCEVTSIEELVSFILQMESYHDYLVDESFGTFTKAELFWNVYERIILADENQTGNDEAKRRDWELYCIRSSNYPHTKEEKIVLSMSLIDFDQVEIEIPKSKQIELNDALEMVAKKMNYITSDLDELPDYKVSQNKTVLVPKTFAELKALLSSGMVFSLLRI